MAASDTLYPTRIFLFTGEKLTTTCSDSFTCAQVKETIWKKKGWNDTSKFDYNIKDYALKIWTSEAWFQDDDKFEEVRKMINMFQDQPERFLVVALMNRSDAGDAMKRTARRPNQGGLLHYQGEIYKLNNQETNWQKRYIVLQDYTMFYWKTERESKTEPAFEVVPLGQVKTELKDVSTNDPPQQSRSMIFRSNSETPGIFHQN